MVIGPILISLLSALSAGCVPLPGIDRILRTHPTDILWLGEVHGVANSGPMVSDIVCHAVQGGRPVVVVLERGASEAPQWDRFLTSDGGVKAVDDLTQGDDWRQQIQDGRNGPALIVLARNLRSMAKQGADIRFAFSLGDDEPDEPQAHEVYMASRVVAAQRAHPAARVIVYSGSAHASKTTLDFNGQPYRSAAALVTERPVYSINLIAGPGEGWFCTVERGCGPQPGGWKAGMRARGLYRTGPADGFDRTMTAGAKAAPSRPAVAAVARPLSAEDLKQALQAPVAPAPPQGAPADPPNLR